MSIKFFLQQIYICFSNPISYQAAKGLLKGRIFKALVNWLWRAARGTIHISLHILNASGNFSCKFSSSVEISNYFSRYFSTPFFNSLIIAFWWLVQHLYVSCMLIYNLGDHTEQIKYSWTMHVLWLSSQISVVLPNSYIASRPTIVPRTLLKSIKYSSHFHICFINEPARQSQAVTQDLQYCSCFIPDLGERFSLSFYLMKLK